MMPPPAVSEKGEHLRNLPNIIYLFSEILIRLICVGKSYKRVTSDI